MPCRSCGAESRDPFTGSSINESRLTNEINRLEDRNNELEAALCAILTEVFSWVGESSYKQILDNASINGEINLKEWVDKHKAEDKERLTKEIKSSYSKHELDLIKQMVMNQEI